MAELKILTLTIICGGMAAGGDVMIRGKQEESKSIIVEKQS